MSGLSPTEIAAALGQAKQLRNEGRLHEAIALLHGNKHKKKDDILLLAYPHLQIYGGSQGLTAQATPGGQAVSGVGAAGGGAAAAGGAGGGK